MAPIDPLLPATIDRFVALGLMLGYHFAMTPTSFADDLQKDWHLVSLTLLPTETVIQVRTTVSHGVPDPVGRDGSSIMSYPPSIPSVIRHSLYFGNAFSFECGMKLRFQCAN